MGRTDTITTSDPALARLHEVTARIRRRAAEERERLAARAEARAARRLAHRGQPLLPLWAPEPPRHWADARDD